MSAACPSEQLCVIYMRSGSIILKKAEPAKKLMVVKAPFRGLSFLSRLENEHQSSTSTRLIVSKVLTYTSSSLATCSPIAPTSATAPQSYPLLVWDILYQQNCTVELLIRILDRCHSNSTIYSQVYIPYSALLWGPNSHTVPQGGQNSHTVPQGGQVSYRNKQTCFCSLRVPSAMHTAIAICIAWYPRATLPRGLENTY